MAVPVVVDGQEARKKRERQRDVYRVFHAAAVRRKSIDTIMRPL